MNPLPYGSKKISNVVHRRPCHMHATSRDIFHNTQTRRVPHGELVCKGRENGSTVLPLSPHGDES